MCISIVRALTLIFTGYKGNTQRVRFSQLALCIPRSSADIFTHSILEKYLGATRTPRYNEVRVIMESQFSKIIEL